MSEKIRYGEKAPLTGSIDMVVIEQLKQNAVENDRSLSKEMELTLLRGMDTPEFVVNEGVYFHLTLEELDIIRKMRNQRNKK